MLEQQHEQGATPEEDMEGADTAPIETWRDQDWEAQRDHQTEQLERVALDTTQELNIPPDVIHGATTLPGWSTDELRARVRGAIGGIL